MMARTADMSRVPATVTAYLRAHPHATVRDVVRACSVTRASACEALVAWRGVQPEPEPEPVPQGWRGSVELVARSHDRRIEALEASILTLVEERARLAEQVAYLAAQEREHAAAIARMQGEAREYLRALGTIKMMSDRLDRFEGVSSE